MAWRPAWSPLQVVAGWNLQVVERRLKIELLQLALGRPPRGVRDASRSLAVDAAEQVPRGMKVAEKIALSLPDGLAERVRRAVRQGRAASVSAYVIALDDQRAREAGQLCGVRGTADVIDASVAL